MSDNLPIVTWSGRVHYRHADEPRLYDSWDRSHSRPMFAAMCNPNTIGYEPIENKAGEMVAREGVEAMTSIDRLPVCKRCEKKATR